MLPNHTDPNYTDICYNITREMCDYCCLVDFEFCARDIGICEPVSDRNLGIVVDCVKALGGILIGFPVIIKICHQLVIYRCCKACFTPELGGVSCYELMFRCMCFFCCYRFSEKYPKDDDVIVNETKKGLLYYALCCCFCPGFIS